MALFIITVKTIYFFPAITAVSLFFLYCLISNKKELNFKFFFYFLLLFVAFFIPLDILTTFFLNWIPSAKASSFLRITIYDQVDLFFNIGFIGILGIFLSCF